MADDNELFELSRRKALAGLGTIGLASAGAGLGTSAFFSDTESFDGNMMTAGELDLVVNYMANIDQGSEGTFSISGDNDGGETGTLSITDIKPGDSGNAKFCFEIKDNPAYLWACGQLTSSSENGYTEPEPEDDNSEGELEENMNVDVVYCTPDGDGGYTTGNTITSGTLRSVLDELSGGIPLDGSGDGSATAGGQAAYDGTTNESGDTGVTNPCVCFEFEVPTSVGNIIQGDSLKFDLQFHAQQARHNDGTNNPCAGITTTTGEGFAKQTENFNDDGTISGGARARYGSGDSTGAWELAVGDDPGGSNFEQAQYSWTSGVTVPWSVSYDAAADELSFTFDGESTITDGLADQPDGRIAVQAKARDSAEVTVSSISTDLGPLSGPTSATAAGNEVSYVLLNTSLDGTTSFTVSGQATVTVPGGFGTDEGANVDIVLE